MSCRRPSATQVAKPVICTGSAASITNRTWRAMQRLTDARDELDAGSDLVSRASAGVHAGNECASASICSRPAIFPSCRSIVAGKSRITARPTRRVSADRFATRWAWCARTGRRHSRTLSSRCCAAVVRAGDRAARCAGDLRGWTQACEYRATRCDGAAAITASRSMSRWTSSRFSVSIRADLPACRSPICDRSG